mmetsp:Transcript_61227/g.177557  ORF Transcript_61227/g.177557 Transcript_61227/m.177557 type:complete len:216 (+) Transcript_61227:73-720(+)
MPRTERRLLGRRTCRRCRGRHARVWFGGAARARHRRSDASSGAAAGFRRGAPHRSDPALHRRGRLRRNHPIMLTLRTRARRPIMPHREARPTERRGESGADGGGSGGAPALLAQLLGRSRGVPQLRRAVGGPRCGVASITLPRACYSALGRAFHDGDGGSHSSLSAREQRRDSANDAGRDRGRAPMAGRVACELLGVPAEQRRRLVRAGMLLGAR